MDIGDNRLPWTIELVRKINIHKAERNGLIFSPAQEWIGQDKKEFKDEPERSSRSEDGHDEMHG